METHDHILRVVPATFYGESLDGIINRWMMMLIDHRFQKLGMWISLPGRSSNKKTQPPTKAQYNTWNKMMVWLKHQLISTIIDFL